MQTIQTIQTVQAVQTIQPIQSFRQPQTQHNEIAMNIHNELIWIDENMIPLITKLNKHNLITRGCCEGSLDSQAYIIFEYNEYLKLITNTEILNFIEKNSNVGNIYYSNNSYRNIKYNEIEYNEKFKNLTEIWIYVQFEKYLINDFANIMENSI